MGLELGCECGDSGDGVFGYWREEGEKASSLVDTTVKEETALVGGDFTPFGFCRI